MKKVKMVVLISLAVLGIVYASRGPEGMTSEQRNKQLVKVAIGAMDNADRETLQKVFSPKFVQHPAGNRKTVEWADFELGCRLAHQKFPTLHSEIEDIIAEGNKVAVRLKTVITFKETNEHGTRGAGKVELTEIDIFRIEGGRIVEEWCEHDQEDWNRKFLKLQYVKTWK